MRIALDDFGTGYSSLTWLQSVPADIVKLDRSFVAGPGRTTRARRRSSRRCCGWPARWSMSVVAEGVEDLEDWNALRAVDCPAVQGYFFSRPLEPAAFAELLVRRSLADRTLSGALG